jgi:hypothetical protein
MKESHLYLELSKMNTRQLQLYLVSCQEYLSDNPASKTWSKAVKTSARILLERWIKEK